MKLCKVLGAQEAYSNYYYYNSLSLSFLKSPKEAVRLDYVQNRFQNFLLLPVKELACNMFIFRGTSLVNDYNYFC